MSVYSWLIQLICHLVPSFQDHSFHWSDQHKAKMRLSVFDRLGAGGRKKKDDQGAAAAAGGKPGDKTGDAAGKSGSPQQNRK